MLRTDVEAICLREGRTVGSVGHAQVRAYLEPRLAEIGLRPYRGETFALGYRNVRGRTDSHNLVGVIPGRDRRLPPLLVGAHYDSVIPAPCADDNAAAVAIVLSAAALLSAMSPARDVVIALFDAEEPPQFLGPRPGSARLHLMHVEVVHQRFLGEHHGGPQHGRGDRARLQ